MKLTRTITLELEGFDISGSVLTGSESDFLSLRDLLNQEFPPPEPKRRRASKTPERVAVSEHERNRPRRQRAPRLEVEDGGQREQPKDAGAWFAASDVDEDAQAAYSEFLAGKGKDAAEEIGLHMAKGHTVAQAMEMDGFKIIAGGSE